MELLSFSVVIFGLFRILAGQYVESPCPDTFEYRSDGYGTHGVIHLKPIGPVTSVQVRANFTIATRLPSSYVGQIEPVGESLTLLRDLNNGIPIKYIVTFPVTSPLPRLTGLTANDNVLCYGPGDIAGPNQYVTTTSLQHTLFLKGHVGPGFFNNYDRPQTSKPDTSFDIDSILGNDAQVFTFGDDDRQGSWNSINYPQSRPEVERPVTRPTPTQPQYYPEVITQAPAPPRPRPQRPTQQTFQTQPPPIPQPVATSPPLQSGPIECGMVAGANERVPLIYNGQSYARGDWPWLVAIYKRKDGSLTFICSGTLISDRHVVSAAHCLQQKNSFSYSRDVVVKVGVYNLEDWGDDITVTRTLASATLHESYNATSLANDILVLTFERRVEFSANIRPACLWTGNPDLSRIIGASGVVAGWGQSEIGAAGRGEPRVVRMPVVSTAVCRASRPDFHKLTSANTLCAGDRNGAGPCLGDSGGGLYILEGGRWQLRGVVSLSLRPDNGDSTCNLNEYIVFTDSAKYFSWIRGVMASG